MANENKNDIDWTDKAKAMLESYQRQHHKNKTPERMMVLEMLYRQTLPIDVVSLNAIISEERPELKVCQTTVYNNLQFLVEAGLAKRLQLLDSGQCFYVRTLGITTDGYFVCRRCGTLRALQTATLPQSIGQQLPKTYRIETINLIVHGMCRTCILKSQKEARLAAKKVKAPIKKGTTAGKLAADKQAADKTKRNSKNK